METLRVSKTTIGKACVAIARIVLFVLALLTVTGCVTAPSTDDPTGESTGWEPGSPESPVKIIVYTDFQCGACERFHSRVEPELRARYVAAGKAQIEMRLLGTLGEESLRAAEATLCAAEQGLFLEYQEALFRACPEGDADTYSKEELVRLAGSLGLDTETFRQTFESRSKRPEIQKNLSMANADGVYTLPAVLINGVKIEGYKPFAVYTQAMEQALGNISSQ